jgi:hypothetical protein
MGTMPWRFYEINSAQGSCSGEDSYLGTELAMPLYSRLNFAHCANPYDISSAFAVLIFILSCLGLAVYFFVAHFVEFEFGARQGGFTHPMGRL